MGSEQIVEAYCDGSVARATLEDVHTSRMSDFTGRIVVIIPELDYGLIEKFYDNLLLPNGHENSLYAEKVAIRRADAICKQKGGQSGFQFVIYCDNGDAVYSAGLSYVKFISPEKFHIADAYLKKVLSRCTYLRGSENRVRNRRPANERQLEITRLMNADHLEFQLSDSPLFRAFEPQVVAPDITLKSDLP